MRALAAVRPSVIADERIGLRIVGAIPVHAPLNVAVASTVSISLSLAVIGISLIAAIAAAVSWITAAIARIAAAVPLITAAVSRITATISRITAAISWIPAAVSRIVAAVSRVAIGVGRAAIAISRADRDAHGGRSPPRPRIPPAAVVVAVSSVTIGKAGTMCSAIVDPYTPVHIAMRRELNIGSG
jgi:hypothetical protein